MVRHPHKGQSTVSQRPAATLTLVVSPIPFAMWRIGLVRKLPRAEGGGEYAIVAVDDFQQMGRGGSVKENKR
ncbi:hypothetical protein LIER_35493 [Lithospermum erythrorhizon]|uniref:Uncharacterized protein n=1 Tax=Lithospermum erythrorhizon TaxID=34254 RepID=A0AAV3NWC8_LITER